MDQKEVRRYLNVIKRAVSYLESMLDSDDGGLLEQMTGMMPQQPHQSLQQPSQAMQQVVVPQPVLAEPSPVPVAPVQPSEQEMQHRAARKKHVGDLMSIEVWPEAVPQFLLDKAVSPKEHKQRAVSVLDFLLDRNIEGLNFLDFGCGEGWITQEAAARGVAEAIGYDLKEDDNWSSFKGLKFTTSYDSLKKNHFDVVMLYDVLDHCHDPIALMAQVKQCMKRDGSVYVRCHPWTSKHAMHLHKNGINKAYIHLFLHWEELVNLLGTDPQFTRKENNPIEAYRWWFNDFEIKKEKMVEEHVSDFFHVDAFKQLLTNEHSLSDIDGFLRLMKIQFIDYVLRIK